MLTLSIIVPTYNRPEDLQKCVASLLSQTYRPDELIVVDDGDLGGSFPLREQCEQVGIHTIYHKKERPGLTASRNAGIELAGGDIIGFLDDDVVLEAGYCAAILYTYQQYGGPDHLGGVGGVITNFEPLNTAKRLRHWLDILFLVSGPVEGRVLPSGFCANFGSSGRLPERVMPVDFLAGGVSSFPRRVFAEFRFNESYKGYGLGEDKDLTWRVSRRYPLLLTPFARLAHYHAAPNRFDRARMGRAIVLYHYRFFNEFLSIKRWHRLFFFYALFGYTLTRALIVVISRKRADLEHLKGTLGASRDILLGRVVDEQQAPSHNS